MRGDVVLYEVDGPVATITLNRPDRLNALTPELIDCFDEALARALADPAVRVVRLRGAGRAFCAGYDVEWGASRMQAVDAAGPWDPIEDYNELSRYARSFMAL